MQHDRSKIKTITNTVTVLLLASLMIYLAVEWKNIPDVVATHFDLSGQADCFGDKSSLIVESAIAVLVGLILAVVECFPQFWNYPVKLTEENRERLIGDGLKLTGTMKILITSLFAYNIICSAREMCMVWPVYILVGAIVIVIIAGIFRMIKDK